MAKSVGRILIVDDEKELCEMLSAVIKQEGLKSLIAYDGTTALDMLRTESPDVLITDFKLPDMNGLKILRKAKSLDEDLPVIFITAYADIHGAVEAIRAGAHDYLSKPFQNEEVIRVVLRALSERNLKRKLRMVSTQLYGGGTIREIMGPSDQITRLTANVNRVSKSDFSIIINGETGSGKEVVAHFIHILSPRSKAPFVPVDCGAIPDSLIESELFGHEKGAFTSADVQKAGKFEAANGGTLFLDEINNLSFGSQAKLLRTLQEKSIVRVGSNTPIRINVRLIVASNQDLHARMGTGLFRSDLFFRLNEFSISIPSLRERKDDIIYLAKRFLDITSVELNKSIEGFSKSAVERLLAYHWPGNVRQLRSTIRRAVLLADDMITEDHLDICGGHLVQSENTSIKTQVPAWSGKSLKEIVRSTSSVIEREILSEVLQKTGGNKAKAARLLLIDYKTIHTKVKEYGIITKGDLHYGDEKT